MGLGKRRGCVRLSEGRESGGSAQGTAAMRGRPTQGTPGGQEGPFTLVSCPGYRHGRRAQASLPPACPFGSGEGSRQPSPCSARRETEARHDYRDPPAVGGSAWVGPRADLRGASRPPEHIENPGTSQIRPTHSPEPHRSLPTTGTLRWGGATQSPSTVPGASPVPHERPLFPRAAKPRTAPSSPAARARGGTGAGAGAGADAAPLRSAVSTGGSGGGRLRPGKFPA